MTIPTSPIAAVKLLREALEFYADPKNIVPGFRAREALRLTASIEQPTSNAVAWRISYMEGAQLPAYSMGGPYFTEVMPRDDGVFSTGAVVTPLYTAPPAPAGASVDEDAALIDKLGKLLAGVAVALKGPEPALTRWSYHDLPKLAGVMALELEFYKAGMVNADGNLAAPLAVPPAKPVGAPVDERATTDQDILQALTNPYCRELHGENWHASAHAWDEALATVHRAFRRAALQQPGLADGWKPIETAPLDGYMLVHEDDAIRALMRIKGVWSNLAYPAIISHPWGDVIVGDDAKRFLPAGYRLEVQDGCCENPTHWMPLPTAPQDKP